MNIQEAKQEIIHTIMAYTAKNSWGEYAIPSLRQRPLLLIGPPGIGKTAIMEQAAAACGVGFVSYTMTHHTRQSAIGLPYIEHRSFGGREYAVTEYTMSEIIASVFRCIEESGCKEGLLFLDEINCVSETLAPAMLQFLQNKTFGSHRLPAGWVLAAAGNPAEYNKSVREFDIATLDRLKYIRVEADYEAWRPYALESGIHSAILSYLDTHKEQFYILNQTYTGKSFVTARGWEDLSCLLWQYEALDLPVTAELTGQYLHCEELAQDFSGYYRLYHAREKELPIPEMMEGNASAVGICRKLLSEAAFDEKLQLVHLMLSCLGTSLHSWDSATCQLKRLEELLERLDRYNRLQNTEPLSKAVWGFLQKEQEVLDIRREHGLSSDQEIRKMQQSLYELRSLAYEYQAASDKESFFPQACRLRKESLDADADHILNMLGQCISLLAPFDGPEFTVFLSSLYQNPLAAAFFRLHPCDICDQYRSRLQFEAREEALKKKLRRHTASKS